jgi:hypothetical protein
MQIQAHHNGNLWSDQGAYLLKDGSIGIVMLIGEHGPVQRE